MIQYISNLLYTYTLISKKNKNIFLAIFPAGGLCVCSQSWQCYAGISNILHKSCIPIMIYYHIANRLNEQTSYDKQQTQTSSTV